MNPNRKHRLNIYLQEFLPVTPTSDNQLIIIKLILYFYFFHTKVIVTCENIRILISSNIIGLTVILNIFFFSFDDRRRLVSHLSTLTRNNKILNCDFDFAFTVSGRKMLFSNFTCPTRPHFVHGIEEKIMYKCFSRSFN